MEQSALKAVINLVEVSELVNLPELLEHRVIEECVALFNSNGTYRKMQKSELMQKLSLQPVDLQEPYIALVDMGMIWRMATPTAEDWQTQDGNPYKWSDYVQKVSSSSFPAMVMLTVLFVWTTHMMQHTPLKMTIEIYGCRAKHTSPTHT